MTKLKKTLVFVVLVFFICLINTHVSAYTITEDSTIQNRAWSFGINCGAAWANKYHADFYNGAEGNQNELSYIFSNQYYRNEIYQVINDSFAIYSMPADMKYKPAFCVGFYVKKNFNNHFGAFMQFNYSKFTTESAFSLKIGATPSTQAFDSTLDCPIWGSEDRINIDIGASYEFPIDEKIFGFVEVGFNLNNTKVRENKIAIQNLEYSIINIYGDQQYIPNTTLQEYPVRQGGIGLGAFLSPGVRFKFSEHIGIDVLGSVYWSKINLKHYNTFRPHFNVMIRFLFSSEYMNSN
ncbi:MAG TPA: hypothetical protein PKW80_12760 [Bacteroidales bacterium]|nr:hypothetical protein [Bacteroidales bacterium]